MALIGENILPESVNSRRRQLRARVSDLREPIRSRRRDLVPSDMDIVGMVESNFTDLRDRFVRRDSVVDRIRSRRGGSNGGMSNGGSNGGNTDSMQNSSNQEVQEVLN